MQKENAKKRRKERRKMPEYYLAVDIGASSGRHMLGYKEDGKMHLEEIYRFENGMANKDGKRIWDVERLFKEIVNGMRRCKELAKIPKSMSIDTWAVDYVLLDADDKVLGETYGYRDERTFGMDEKVYQIISERELYERTGIQKQIFNTVYQLMAVKEKTPEIFERARTFLMLPDYFQFLLTGEKRSEYTNATSTQLVSPETKQWDGKLIGMLGYPAEIFLPLSMPGTKVGTLREEIQREVGYDCAVVQCASHDTASAVMALPKEEGAGMYISSGTWSLMGVELEKARCDEESRRDNFTNEGGYDYRFRYLKNIMGLWIIQSVRHELEDRYSFARLCEMAEEKKDFHAEIDVNDSCFFAPESMTEAITDYCAKKGEPVPADTGELAAAVYQNLAASYERTAVQIEERTKEKFDSIYVIGGGSNAAYLNQLTANRTGKRVYAGPSEATAIGNLMAQMIASGALLGLGEGRRCVLDSFDINIYEPEGGR